VEVPLTQWRDRLFIRVSVQGYNESSDIDRLIAALEVLLRAEIMLRAAEAER
jgi:selenocysteine lyase/cysteine desulfurase